MERLTIKAPSGLIHLKDNKESTMNTAIKKLSGYEDLQDRLDEVFSGYLDIEMFVNAIIEYAKQHYKDEKISECMIITNDSVRKYREWEKLDEHGKLLKLPCKVGDIVWDNDFGRPCSYEATGFSFGNLNDESLEEDMILDQLLVHYSNSSGSITGSFAVSEIGKTIFMSKEEAEIALKGLKNGKES